MLLAEPPAITQPSQPDDFKDVILVVGRQANQVLKIDRRTYQVQQNAHSAQKDAIQLLRGLPAITVTPDDQIMLLGNPGVSIYVDGHPYAGESTQYLRTLHGTDVDRIEVITNPSAQYSAEGSGGIINFVLRAKRNDGVSGSASLEMSSNRRLSGDGALKDKHGRWTYELEGHAALGTNGRSTFRELRSVEQTIGGSVTSNSAEGGKRTRQIAGSAAAKVSYEFDTHTSLAGKLTLGSQRSETNADTQYVGLTPDFRSFSEHQYLRASSPFIMTEINFNHRGKSDDDTLTSGFQLFGSPADRSRNEQTLDDGTSLSIRQNNRLLTGRGQIDWQHKLASGQIVSGGISGNFTDTRQNYRFMLSQDHSSLDTDFAADYRARSVTLAAYTTFQQTFGHWTLMPGIRAERNSRKISAAKQPDVVIDRTNLFPTFHLDRPLSKTIDFTMSYSKRIDRPPVEYVRPYLIVVNVLSSAQGNMRLKNQATDSYEINIHYHRDGTDAGIIVYDRETNELWSKSYIASPTGVSTYTYINSGHSHDLGAEFDVSTSLMRRLKANLSLNLFRRRLQVASPAGSIDDNSLRYTTNATLEWDGPDRNGKPGDIARLQWLFASPARDFEVKTESSNWLSFAYTRSLSKELAVTGTVNYLGSSRRRLWAPFIQDYYAERNPLEVKVKVMRTFGKR
ncbi:MAG TPA: outer membrane beta-barrel protein [Chthoniobacterales bacterium]|nr:outer membrane beta-barrel protein [Chthoniobacterales bacterium]